MADPDNGLDPPQPQAQQAATAPQAQPQGGGGLMDRWNTFIDHPENRAGLMQFAVNMLSGKGFGESVGSAAEASGRNITSQQEEQRYEEAQALKEQEAARKEKETEYYGIGQRKKSAADTYYEHADFRAGQEAARAGRNKFDAWMADDLPDSRFKALQTTHPELKRKADLWDPKNKALLDEAKTRFFPDAVGGVAGRPAPPNSEERMGADGRIHYFQKGTQKYLGVKE